MATIVRVSSARACFHLYVDALGRISMSDGTQHFAVSDVEYDIITTMSNLLQSEDVLRKYSADAEEAGNTEVLELFRALGNSNNDFAKRLRGALKNTLND